ncbi:uncharacterized protein LOC133728724 [Rosa rugosa]|uniref:uncharacterized protein LOC133728724 n=1 Tax=Rosa rugosa TaxID=74645 RepID=UPI002B406187|nr:uncharacterized protein LOC133728724 [Rosa rugosa]
MALGKVKELVSSNPVVIFRFSLPLHLLMCVYIYRIVDRFEPIWKFDNKILFRSNKLCPHCVCVKQLFVLKLGVQYKAIELDQEMSVYMLQTKLTKHVCGICKKWNQPDNGSWVRNL